MRGVPKNFVLVRYWPGSGGKFLTSYLYQLFSILISNNIDIHAHDNAEFNSFHNFSEIVWDNEKSIERSLFVNSVNYDFVKSNLHIVEELKKEFRMYIPDQKNFCYLSETHACFCEKIYSWIQNLKIINIIFDEDDLYDITKKFVIKRKKYLNLSNKEFYSERFDNNLSYMTEITEEFLINKIYNLNIKQYKVFLEQCSSFTVPTLEVSYKKIFDGTLSKKERALEFCEFMGTEFSEKHYQEAIKVYSKYLDYQSLV